MAVNATSVFLGTTRAASEMAKTGGGSIVNISSIMGFIGGADGHPGYSASKGEVRIFHQDRPSAFRTDRCKGELCTSGLLTADAQQYEYRRTRLQGRHTTGSLEASGLLRIVTAAITSSIAPANPDINGALLGVAAWILSYAVETAVSTWRLRWLGWYEGR